MNPIKFWIDGCSDGFTDNHIAMMMISSGIFTYILYNSYTKIGIFKSLINYGEYGDPLITRLTIRGIFLLICLAFPYILLPLSILLILNELDRIKRQINL